ncbi:MAG TPA: hypothetical protein PKV98_18225 [Burkholderiaceae bacterium]|nr:hypothetical protein [Burkholderiaceae bacterium]
MNTGSILASLQTRLRGLHGHLPEVARLSTISYSAVVQLARGSYPASPSLKTVDRLNAACAVVERKRKARK